MFSRRHPYLYFILVFTAIVSGTTIITGLLTMVGSQWSKLSFGEKVGVVEINAMIVDAKDYIAQIKTFSENEAIRAIVIRVDSPGGAVAPSQEIYREIRKAAAGKPVIASMGTIAASGGYYIAAAADKIVANPGTITGSIGVILGYTNFEKLFEKIGLYPVVIKSGQYKDIGSPVREMTPEEKALLQQFSDGVHNQFIEHVAEGRGMAVDEIRQIADGRIISGETALSLGLVDRLGNLEDAIEWAGREGGIKGAIDTVYPPEKKLPLLRYLLDEAASEIRTILGRQGGASPIAGGYIYSPE
jgi:protease IV